MLGLLYSVMKILHFAETVKGGVESVLLELISEFSKMKGIDEIAVVLPDDAVELVSKFSAGKVKFFLFNRDGRNLKTLFAASVTYNKAMQEFQPDIVHLHSTFAGFIGRLLPKNKSKIVYCAHSWSFDPCNEITSPIKRFIFCKIERILSYRTERIINLSEHDANCCSLAKIELSRTKVIPNGVSDLAYITRETSDVIESNKIKILFAGRFDQQKGFDRLLQWIDEGIPEHVSLTLVGDWVVDQADAKEREIVEDAPVKWLGWLKREEVLKELAASDVLVLPSRWEGMPMIVIESLALGTPVVGADIPVLREMLTDGENGYIIDFNAPHGLQAKFHTISKSQLVGMRLAARKEFVARYQASAMASATYNVYKEIYYAS